MLEILNLSDIPLGCGIMELTNYLNFVPGLTELWLNDTQMGEEEVSGTRPLKNVPDLDTLNLSSNQLGRGVSVLIQHLSSVPELGLLKLDGVDMTKSEAEELYTAGKRLVIFSDYHVSVLFLLTFICTLENNFNMARSSVANKPLQKQFVK